MDLRRKLAFLAAAAALTCWAPGALAYEEASLLTPDGTVYQIQSGKAIDLGVSGQGIYPGDEVLEWSFKRQDGSKGIGVIMGAVNRNPKSDLRLAYDAATGSLVLLWKEDLLVVDVLHFAIMNGGNWTLKDLLPNFGFAHVSNPQIVISEHWARYEDEAGRERFLRSSVLHAIWWEDSATPGARYAPVFLGEDNDARNVRIYDLKPTSAGATSVTPEAAHDAYRYPSLLPEGQGGEVLAAFTDMQARKYRVLQIRFPKELGRIGSSGADPNRRRAPIFVLAADAPVPAPAVAANRAPVRTLLSVSGQPTLVWSDENSVNFTRYDGQRWSSVKRVTIGEDMPAERAFRLVEEMAKRY